MSKQGLSRGPNNLGVPITIFGKGFGGTKGNATITINGVEVASYPVWGQNNANNAALDMIVVQPGSTISAGPVVLHIDGKDSNNDHGFTPTTGTVYYVAPAGLDSMPCSELQPCATIHHAATNRMQAGDALLVRGGNLNDDEIWIRDVLGHSGQPGKPKIIRNYPGEQPTFTMVNRPFIVDANYITLSGFHFTGGKSLGLESETSHDNKVYNSTFRGTISWDAIGSHGNNHVIAGNDCDVTNSTQGTQGHCYYISHGSHLRLLYNVGRGAPGYGIHVFDQRRSTPDIQRVISDVLIEGNLLAGSPERSGLILAMGDEGGMGNYINNVTIRNNIFTANNHVGIAIGPIVRNVRIYNNTFYKNGRQGVTIYDEPTINGVEITNNLFDQSMNANCLSNCSWYQDAHVQKGTRAQNVQVSNNYYAPGPTIVMGATDAAGMAGPAGFVNGGSLDFHLQDGSLAINRGTTLPSVARDFDGRLRPVGGTHDPGAFEHP
jgi:hypothetical protein